MTLAPLMNVYIYTMKMCIRMENLFIEEHVRKHRILVEKAKIIDDGRFTGRCYDRKKAIPIGKKNEYSISVNFIGL